MFHEEEPSTLQHNKKKPYLIKKVQMHVGEYNDWGKKQTIKTNKSGEKTIIVASNKGRMKIEIVYEYKLCTK